MSRRGYLAAPDGALADDGGAGVPTDAASDGGRDGCALVIDPGAGLAADAWVKSGQNGVPAFEHRRDRDDGRQRQQRRVGHDLVAAADRDPVGGFLHLRVTIETHPPTTGAMMDAGPGDGIAVAWVASPNGPPGEPRDLGQAFSFCGSGTPSQGPPTPGYATIVDTTVERLSVQRPLPFPAGGSSCEVVRDFGALDGGPEAGGTYTFDVDVRPESFVVAVDAVDAGAVDFPSSGRPLAPLAGYFGITATASGHPGPSSAHVVRFVSVEARD